MARILKHGITEEASASNNAQVRQTVENKDLRAGEQSAVKLKTWVFCCCADERDNAFFDIG